MNKLIGRQVERQTDKWTSGQKDILIHTCIHGQADKSTDVRTDERMDKVRVHNSFSS